MKSLPERNGLCLAVCALALLACVPHPGGQCEKDAACGYGLTCQDGLCRTRPPRTCEPGCGAGFHCDDGTCSLDVAPVVRWESPDDGAFRSGGQVALALRVETPARDVAVHVLAIPSQAGALAQPVRLALVADGDGRFRALLDAGALEEREWKLLPQISAARAEWGGQERALRIDRSGPAVELFLPRPLAGAFLRTETIEVRARISDVGAGVDPATPAAVAPGMTPVPGTRLSATDWSFRVPLSQPDFASAEGPLSLSVVARDRAGNGGAGTGAVPVTRLLWRRDVGGGLPVRSSPALDAHHLYVGSDAGRLVALDRQSSALLWSRTLAGPIGSSPARGERLVYGAGEGGGLSAFDPDTGERVWSCAALPEGASFASSPAVAQLPGLGADGAPLEVVYLSAGGSFDFGGATNQGGLFAVQGSAGFPLAGGARGCAVYSPAGGGRSSPAVGMDGAVYAGGTDARAHKLRLAADATGAFAFREEWSLPAGDEVLASPAVSDEGIVFGAQSGLLLWVRPDGSPLFSEALAVGERLLASPVFSFRTVLAQGREGRLAPFAASASAAHPPIYVQQRLSGASGIESTPAIGAEGTVYVSAGRSLRALSPGGAVLWEAPLLGAATASSPVIGCDGTLYVGDASGHVSALATDSRGLAPGWPRFRHDARGTGNAGTAGCE